MNTEKKNAILFWVKVAISVLTAFAAALGAKAAGVDEVSASCVGYVLGNIGRVHIV